jgi:O-acetyl-ADP-ribose deacetylase (regulator of RNase III)
VRQGGVTVTNIHIVKKGITKLDVDCVVNAANEGLWAGGGVCGAIFREASYDKLEEACREIGHCDTGSAVITPGFDLKAKYIIHAVGPRWQGGNEDEDWLLRKCYMTAMLLAKDNGCKSIGFPLISSGIFGYPKREAWEVALRAVDDTQLDMEVYFAVLDDGMLELGNQVYKDLLG